MKKVYPVPARPAVELPLEVKIAGVKALGVDLVPISLEWWTWKRGRGREPLFRLVAEPWNPVDANAIRVEWWRGSWNLVGYIPAALAANLEAENYSVRIRDVLHNHGRYGTGLPSGIRLSLEASS